MSGKDNLQWLTDAHIEWRSHRPTVENVQQEIESFLGGAGIVTQRYDGITITLPGAPLMHKEWVACNEACQRQFDSPSPRWILVTFGEHCITVKCCVQDRFTLAIAKALCEMLYARRGDDDRETLYGVPQDDIITL